MELLATVLPALLKGAAVTLQVTVQSSILALIISLVVGLLREIKHPFVRVPTVA
jgi:ABC-type arginine/histidine transport system permease subunit